MGTDEDIPADYDGERFALESQAVDALDAMSAFFSERGRSKMADATAHLARVLAIQNEDWSERKMYGSHITVYQRPETERKQVDPAECPDQDSDEYNWQWHFSPAERTKYDEDRAYFKEKVDPDAPDLLARRAIVFQADIQANAPDQDLYDPYRGEYNRPSDYPFGTVNCIVAAGKNEFGADYCSDVEVVTSVTPVSDPTDPSPHGYAPGWPEDPYYLSG